MLLASLLYIPPEDIRKPQVFWCFRGYKKRTVAWDGLTYTAYLLFFIVTARQNPCENNLCENGAACIPEVDGSGYKCLCQVGYQGKYCQGNVCRFSRKPIINNYIFKNFWGRIV